MIFWEKKSLDKLQILRFFFLLLIITQKLIVGRLYDDGHGRKQILFFFNFVDFDENFFGFR